MSRVCRWLGLATGLMGLLAWDVRADELAAAPLTLTVRPIRIDEQLTRVLALFEGAAAPHPAAALAAWRQATGRHDALGKAPQALIACLNPAMVPELRKLEGTVAWVTTSPVRWSAVVPADDGTFRAMGTSLTLTDGAIEAPEGAISIDRLGPPGAPLLAARPGGGLALGSDRHMLLRALAASEPASAGPAVASGWAVTLDVPSGDRPVASPVLDTVLASLGCRQLDAVLGVEGDALGCTITGRFEPLPTLPRGDLAIDSRWLDGIPAGRTTAALALAIDPSPGAWDRVFELADRLEKRDPARARAGPLRARFNLAALAFGFSPEAELWPVVRGLTVTVVARSPQRPECVGVALHTVDPAAAQRLAERLERILVRLLGETRIEGGTDPRRLGELSDQPVELAVRDRTVYLGWGPGWVAACLEATNQPGRVAAQAGLGSGPLPQRLGILWPGRLPGLEPGPLVETLAEAPLVLWTGTTTAATTTDVVRWSGLRGSVQRFLARIPQAPTPATLAR